MDPNNYELLLSLDVESFANRIRKTEDKHYRVSGYAVALVSGQQSCRLMRVGALVLVYTGNISGGARTRADKRAPTNRNTQQRVFFHASRPSKSSTFGIHLPNHNAAEANIPFFCIHGTDLEASIAVRFPYMSVSTAVP
jgi:hypothetical protein